MSQSEQKPVIVLGADHGGFTQKQAIRQWLTSQKYDVRDVGAAQLDPEDDYPQFAKAVVKEVLQLEESGALAYGMLLCRSGAGMLMAANRFRGVRAAGALTEEQARHARAHNDANVLVLSGDWMDESAMKNVVTVFLTTPFSAEERHQRRIDQIDQV